jgi:hypothetical protein
MVQLRARYGRRSSALHEAGFTTHLRAVAQSDLKTIEALVTILIISTGLKGWAADLRTGTTIIPALAVIEARINCAWANNVEAKLALEANRTLARERCLEHLLLRTSKQDAVRRCLVKRLAFVSDCSRALSETCRIAHLRAEDQCNFQTI